MSTTTISRTKFIQIRGARVHNLKNIDVDIPRDALVVLSGVSGSGKSSLAFDTLFAEGQRRYLDSLSTYTRQYLNQLERPDVDRIDGLPPTISVSQSSGSARLRSTLATTTQIADYLRLLFARAGQAHCPQCGKKVERQTAQAIVSRILELEQGHKVIVLAPLVRGRKGMHRKVFETICKEGFVRARVDGQIVDAGDPPELDKNREHTIEVVVDRIIVKEGIRARLGESVDLALAHGDGACLISFQDAETWIDRLYSTKFACATCSASFLELEPRTFSFNSPYGACEQCEGLGFLAEAADDEEHPDKTYVKQGPRCPACHGSRLNPFASAVTVGGQTLKQLSEMPVAGVSEFFDEMSRVISTDAVDDGLFSPEQRGVAERTVPEIAQRLQFLCKVGLDYLSLDRSTRSLSGGEFQRARLAGCLGSGLIGVCYVLDEPTIGLHPRDTGRLIDVLCDLRDRGNSVLVVEHDEDVMRRADCLIDIGPGAGSEGGEVVAYGTPDEVAKVEGSPTGRYLARIGSSSPSVPAREVNWKRCVTLKAANTHNLKNVDVRIPLDVLTVVSGVSGSGKSSLITQTLVPALRAALIESTSPVDGARLELSGDGVSRLVVIDQSPFGRSGRSSPATYSGAWDIVRKLYSQTRDARVRGFTARRFSFNSPQGRCRTCKGQGTERMTMHFMPDVDVTCPMCKGARFNRQTLSVRYRGLSLADVLDMRFDEAREFFKRVPRLSTILETFHAVGLGYLSLGQPSLTLSGGEAQRVKLASELSRTSPEQTLFILDEPTTGLHPADIERLLSLLKQLVERGNSVVVVEHQLDVIAAADWVIDLGPDGGQAGGSIIAEGPPHIIASAPDGHTAQALRVYLRG